MAPEKSVKYPPKTCLKRFMRILFHIDYLVSAVSKPECDPLLKHCREKTLEAWVLPSFIPAVYQSLRQSMEDKAARESIRRLLSMTALFPMTGKDVENALTPDAAEFPATLSAGAVDALNLEAVVTLNPEAFSQSGINAITPEEALERLHSEKTAVTRVPMLDIPASYHECLGEIEHGMFKVLRSSHFILGSHVEELEAKVAHCCGTEFAVGVSSGTDALLVSLMALGVGAGDEVITTPFTFFATMGSILRTGARPVFVDIDADTFNISPGKIEQAITGKTKAILPVHLYGQCADMDPIFELAERRSLPVIEDAAQAIGAEYKNRKAGSLGHAGCFSFYPTKNLGGFGDGGMVTVSSQGFRDKIISLRNHGSRSRYMHDAVGGNFRLDAMQAAVLSAKIEHLQAWNDKRRANAANYQSLFEQSGLSSIVKTPIEKTGRHVYHQYVIRVWESKRNELMNFLKEKGIGTAIYYPVPLHLQSCIEHMGYQQGDFPIAEKAAGETLALPISHEVTFDQQEYVVSAIKKFFK